jgi:hypothetical protein
MRGLDGIDQSIARGGCAGTHECHQQAPCTRTWCQTHRTRRPITPRLQEDPPRPPDLSPPQPCSDSRILVSMKNIRASEPPYPQEKEKEKENANANANPDNHKSHLHVMSSPRVFPKPPTQNHGPRPQRSARAEKGPAVVGRSDLGSSPDPIHQGVGLRGGTSAGRRRAGPISRVLAHLGEFGLTLSHTPQVGDMNARYLDTSK